jgi:hypothetical protein
MSMELSLELFCGVWSKKSEHKADSITVSQPQRSSADRNRSRDWCLPNVKIDYIGWRDCLCFWPTGIPTFDVGMRSSTHNQSIVNEELFLASYATAWRWCVAGTSHLKGTFWFNFTSQRMCFATSAIGYNKLIPVLAKLKWGINVIYHYASPLL